MTCAAILLFFLFDCRPPGKDTPASDPSSLPPNVLFIAVDDLNDWIQLLDSTAPIRTPNLQRLAAQGMLFTKAYCASPTCNASRTALLTGIMPATSGVYGNKTDWRSALPKAVTIPGHFMSNGYTTVGAGKIFHHHFGDAFHDKSSFQDFLFMPDPPDAPMPKEKLNGLSWFGSENSDWGLWPSDDATHVDVRTADYVIEQLEKDHAAPFFLAAGIFRPHMPFFAPKKYFDQYPAETTVMPTTEKNDWDDLPTGAQTLMAKTKWFFEGIKKADRDKPGTYREAVRAYQACATFADAQIGRILDALERSRHRENTIVVLWSDHGYHLGEKEHWEKFALWEKSTHVPLIIVAPGVTKPGSIFKEPVSLVDIFPTLNELCALPDVAGLEGISLAPQLNNAMTKRYEPAVMTYLENNHAIRSDQWRYIRYADGSEELYNLQTDPAEWTNLAGQRDNRVVMDSLARWLPKLNVPAYADLKRKPSKEKTK